MDDYNLLLSLANIRWSQGKLAEAGFLLDRALASAETTKGRDSVDFQNIRLWEGHLLYLKGDYSAAEELFRETCHEIQTVLPKAKAAESSALYWQGSALVKMNRAREAGPLFRQAPHGA